MQWIGELPKLQIDGFDDLSLWLSFELVKLRGAIDNLRQGDSSEDEIVLGLRDVAVDRAKVSVENGRRLANALGLNWKPADETMPVDRQLEELRDACSEQVRRPKPAERKPAKPSLEERFVMSLDAAYTDIRKRPDFKKPPDCEFNRNSAECMVAWFLDGNDDPASFPPRIVNEDIDTHGLSIEDVLSTMDPQVIRDRRDSARRKIRSPKNSRV